MPLPFLPAILSGLGTAAGAVGTAAASPLGQHVIGTGIGMAMPGIANKISDWWSGPQQPGPDRQAQQAYLQRIQQPFQLNQAQRQQQLLNQFRQDILPGIRERYAGMGAGGRSSAFARQMGEAEGNFLTNLGALGEQNALQEEQMNQGRMGQLGGYLGGQQALGMQAQQMGQTGTIAQQNAALQRMLQMANYNVGQQEQLGNQQNRYANIMRGLGDQTQGIQFDTRHFAGQPAGYQELVRQLGPAAARAMMISLGLPI